MALAWQLDAATWVIQLVAVLALIDFTLVAQFFRVPNRTPVAGEGQILCPPTAKLWSLRRWTSLRSLGTSAFR